MLLHAADAAAARPVRNCRSVYAADGDGSCLRRIQPQQELKNRAFARTGPADERDLLALLDGHGKIAQDGRFAVAEGDVRQHDIAACSSFAVLHGALGLGKKSVDAPDACHCRLDGLDFHAETFNGRKNARDVVDHGNRGADRHTEQR